MAGFPRRSFPFLSLVRKSFVLSGYERAAQMFQPFCESDESADSPAQFINFQNGHAFADWTVHRLCKSSINLYNL